MFKIAICDDDREYIDELKKMILECNGGDRDICFEEYSSGIQLLKYMTDGTNILFLDIQMNGLDGNETARLLKERNFQGVLVQCSGIYNPTPETIVISPYRYLLKQDPREKTLVVLGEILEEADKQNKCFALEGSFRREKIMVKTSDILYLTRYRGGSTIHLLPEQMDKFSDGSINVSETLECLEEKLESLDFAMPHNSYLINLRYIRDYDVKTGRIELKDQTFFISRSKKKDFMEKLMKYMRTKYKGNL